MVCSEKQTTLKIFLFQPLTFIFHLSSMMIPTFRVSFVPMERTDISCTYFSFLRTSSTIANPRTIRQQRAVDNKSRYCVPMIFRKENFHTYHRYQIYFNCWGAFGDTICKQSNNKRRHLDTNSSTHIISRPLKHVDCFETLHDSITICCHRIPCY